LNERIVSKPSAKTAFGIGPFARAFSFASMYQAASDFFPECAERFALCAGVTIDLSTGQMSVSGSIEQTKGGKKALPFKSPKSGKGRTVELSPTVVEELRTHRAKRAEVLLRLGVRLSEDDFVTAHPDGSVMVPIYISQRWDRFIKTTKLPRIRFHDLRHTHATHMLANDVRPKIRQRAPGTQQGGDHPGPLQPRHSGHAGGRCGNGGCCAEGRCGKREQNGSSAVVSRIGGAESE
jgi:hypothetical protein